MLTPRLPEMLSTLRNFVTVESPSLEKAAADRCCGVIADGMAQTRRTRRAHRAKTSRRSFAHHLVARESHALSGSFFVLGHYDTVYATRHARENAVPRRRPARLMVRERFDMKAGIVQALFALDALQRSRGAAAQAHRLSVDFRRRDRQRVFPQID